MVKKLNVNTTLVILILLGVMFLCYIAVQINIKKAEELEQIAEEESNKRLIESFTNQDDDKNDNDKNDNDKNDNDKNDNDKNNDKIHYMYWTGGYDSTFRLCQMLINERKKVQPIYISMVLDNDCESEETCNKLWLRRNRKEERMAMKKINDMLSTKFPFTKQLLLPVLEIDKGIDDNNFNYKFEQLFYNDNLWPRKRRKHQYLFLSKYAYFHKKSIDIGVLGIHQGSKFAEFLKNTLVRTIDNYVIPNKKHALGYLSFPLYGKTKEDLLKDAKKENFDDILKASWSCWFPKNGKPCKKCPMCRERIVEHPSNDS